MRAYQSAAEKETGRGRKRLPKFVPVCIPSPSARRKAFAEKNEPGTVAELICAYIDLCPTLSVAPVEVFDQKPLTIRRLLTTAAANFVFEVNPVFDSILLMCFLMQSGVTQRMSPISL